ncbi:hypothetical protein GW17_00052705 [Ensete ventricosum]|nr:hypothetical protein GW17_00052705 [Ensete ventricosum]
MAGACRGGACGHRQCPRSGCKGQPPAARSQGAIARCEAARGSPAALQAAAGRSSARARRPRPPARCRPRAATLVARAAVFADGVQHRCLQRAAATVTHRGQEERSRSVEVTTGPTISWLEITTHGDALIRRN